MRCLLQPNLVDGIPARHVGKNDDVAWLESREHLNVVDGCAPYLDGDAGGGFAVGAETEEADGGVLVAEGRPADVEHVLEAVEIDGAVDGEVWARAGGKGAIE